MLTSQSIRTVALLNLVVELRAFAHAYEFWSLIVALGLRQGEHCTI